MNYSSKNPDRQEEKPPHSRLFVVCSRNLKEKDLRSRFEKFGTIEDIHMPKDRGTGEPKGFAYIKYAKTSSAAAAIQELHMKVAEGDSKPMKVMLAINRNGGPTQNENDDDYRRLFIKVDKDVTESQVRLYFSKFGRVESVHVLKDKATDVGKGFAYVVYKTFHDAAVAYEECDKIYKPMFAAPRNGLKRSRNSLDDISSPRSFQNEKYSMQRCELPNKLESGHSGQDFSAVVVKCSPQLPQKYIESLFNVIPGMLRCQYSVDAYNGISTAIITYAESKYAAFAVERLNHFQFPSGEIITVKPDNNTLVEAAEVLTSMVNNFKHAIDRGTPDLAHLADAIAQASTLIKAATNISTSSKQENTDFQCSVNLPPKKELANINSKVAQRLFIICKPQPPPIYILRDLFSRFGDMIDVSTFPNKTFGFVKYASISAAQDAIKTLNGATVCGIRLKVLEADEKPVREEDVKMGDKTEDDTMNTKRKRLDTENTGDI
ncbi:RNA-binding protein 45-like [Aricia agestis]|uniref:RNA-binding protein 45-like n=1 Tax=Aricia agestis TaxID=91739 RepID=UPI001C20C319|nr:RNA-binding protein 45-like [Aricia agestis]